MIFHLSASTDAAGYAIFDPAALPKRIGRNVEESFETILTQNALGNLILFSDAFSGSTSVRVCVDEDPGDALRLRAAHAASGGVCRFPSGRVVFAGVEDLQQSPEPAD